MKYALIIVALLSVCDLCFSKELPPFVKKCRRDSELSNCVKDAMLRFRKLLPAGVEELKLPAMEPYTLKSVGIDTTWMNISFTDFKLYNSFDYEVDYFKIDLENNFIVMNLTQRYMEIKSHYQLFGQLIQFGLQGSGEVEANFTNTKTECILYGSKIQKKGKEYLNLEKSDFKLKADALDHFYLHDLFRNNPILTERINQLLDENRNEFAVEIMPLIEKITGEIIMSYFKGVFDTYALNELFI